MNATGNFGAKIFNGDHVSLSSDSGSALVSVDGHSYIPAAAPGVPVYYQANWTATTQTTGDGQASTGTYDPWVVHYSDLAAAGVPVGGTATLYYQTGLGGGYSASSGFDLVPGAVGQYSFSASASPNGQTLNFFTITNNSKTGLSTTFNSYADFSVYELRSYAHANSATPGQRRSAAITQITTASQLLALIAGDTNPDGSLIDNLDFGIYYDNVVYGANKLPTDTVIAWHTDTAATV